MKKVIFIIISIIASLSLIGCGKKIEVKQDEEITPYHEILSLHKKAATENWSREQYEGQDLCYLFSYQDSKLETIGYLIDDINNDGVKDLIVSLVGESEMPFVLELYTIVNDSVKKVLTGGERNSYYITTDGYIGNIGSNSAFSGAHMLYRINEGELIAKEGIIYDYQVNEQEPYFKTLDNDFDTSNDEKILSDEAIETMNMYEAKRKQLPLIPIKDFQ